MQQHVEAQGQGAKASIWAASGDGLWFMYSGGWAKILDSRVRGTSYESLGLAAWGVFLPAVLS